MERQVYANIRSRLDFGKYASTWIAGLVLDALLIGASSWFAYGNFLDNMFAAVLLACLYFRAFGFMHEAVHGTLSSDRKINNALGLLWGTLCFLPYAQWRTAHLEHHYWAGNIEKDPVMKLVWHVKNGGRFPRLIEWCWRRWVPALAFLQELVFWSNSWKLLKSGRGLAIDYLSFVLPLGVWGVVFWQAGWPVVAQVFLPSILFYLLLVEVVNIPHHLELVQREGDEKVQVWDQHLISRSCIYPRWFERVVLLNFNFHTEHHLYPTLPYKELEKAHRLVKTAFRGEAEFNVEPGFDWIIRNRRRPLTEVLYHAPAKDQIKRSS